MTYTVEYSPTYRKTFDWCALEEGLSLEDAIKVIAAELETDAEYNDAGLFTYRIVREES